LALAVVELSELDFSAPPFEPEVLITVISAGASFSIWMPHPVVRPRSFNASAIFWNENNEKERLEGREVETIVEE
jgi:hypothetical protein